MSSNNNSDLEQLYPKETGIKLKKRRPSIKNSHVNMKQINDKNNQDENNKKEIIILNKSNDVDSLSSLSDIEDEHSYMSDIGKCSDCGDECNPMSQLCGSCARYLTATGRYRFKLAGNDYIF